MVTDLIKEARQAARKYLETLYENTCTVYHYIEQYDDDEHCTKVEKEVLYEDIPCKLSYGMANTATETDTVTHLSQIITLFVSPEYDIPAGSLIYINGIIYEASGEPLIFPTHIEIGLLLAKQEA